MKDEYKIPAQFNSVTYMVVDRVTGEEIDIRIFVEQVGKDKWEKAFAKTLSEYIGAGGNSVCSVLAYIIRNHNPQNLVLATYSEIAEECKCSPTTVGKFFKALYAKKLMHEVRGGCYFLSPNVMSYGKKSHGAMLLRLWDKETNNDDAPHECKKGEMR